MTGDVAALAVGEHEQARARARARRRASSASQPATPSRSKQASCGLTATQAGPGGVDQREAVREHRGGGLERGRLRLAAPTRRSTSRAISCAAAKRLGEAARAPRTRDSSAPGHSRAGIGIDPEDDLRLARRDRGGEAVAERDDRAGDASPAPDKAPPVAVLLDGLLEARAGGEARDPAGGDRHRLARARVAALAGAALGDVELAEAGEVDFLARR